VKARHKRVRVISHGSRSEVDGHEVDQFVQELTTLQEELLVVIRSFCGDPVVASDIRQAVNIVLWKKREKFKLGTNFRAWAFGIARIETRSYFRKRKREGFVALDPELMESMTEELEEVSAEFEMRKRALRQCLELLTEKDTELVRHHYWKRGTLQALAEATGRSAGTLRARLHQVRTNLRRCVNRRVAEATE